MICGGKNVLIKNINHIIWQSTVPSYGWQRTRLRKELRGDYLELIGWQAHIIKTKNSDQMQKEQNNASSNSRAKHELFLAACSACKCKCYGWQQAIPVA